MAARAAVGGLALVLAGDIMLGRNVDEALSARPAHAAGVWGDVLPLLHGGMAAPGGAQLNAGNLECSVTDAEEKNDSCTFNFRMRPGNLAALREARWDFLALANNHCLDYKEAGLRDTLRTLRGAGIAHAGAGLDDAQAAAPAVVERGGLRVAFFSLSDHFLEWAAGPGRPGINLIRPASFSAAELQRQLSAAPGAALRVVFVHWGPNWAWRPSPAIQALGRALVDAGADVVVGSSAHHVQGVQVYRGRPIIHGAGAFVDDYRLHEDYRNDLAFLFCCRCDDAGVPAALEAVPTRIHRDSQEPGTRPPYLPSVHLARGRDAAWLRRKLLELSKPWDTRICEAADGRLSIPLRDERSGGGNDAA